jgi:D-alanyl-D-alanine carboxypeptidase
VGTVFRFVIARLHALLFGVVAFFTPFVAHAAPYASMIMDARSGEVLYSRNADTRLHPASLTKMMTLYVVFDAVQRGEISMDTEVRISKKAAAEPPSKLGLKAGQKIKLRFLVRAAAVKSANDAATAMAEAISGSEAAFARRMNRTAKAIGMTRTTFKNAHGLTEKGHLSTARDMTVMGRRLFYDYPDYYNLFSRRATDAGIRDVANTNRRLLNSYEGADGIKTGYTRAAGYNLVASAKRGRERVIATVFGGRSVATRNAHVAELLDKGFKLAPSRVAVRKPATPVYTREDRSQRPTVTAVVKSRRPRPRPGPTLPPGELTAGINDAVNQTLALVEQQTATRKPVFEGAKGPLVDLSTPPALPQGAAKAPPPRPRSTTEIASGAAASAVEVSRKTAGEQVVTRLSTAGARHWSISIGEYGSRHQAERMLLETALLELGTLDEALRKVVKRSGGFEANFVGLSAEQANMACQRLVARQVICDASGPG